ncbi:MAG: NAD(P)-dependent glycerol-3-phosphate dehydrogenase [Oscillospiraceae bacterium]|nr:NAD(P)-dependent glycerol-3-phosphate dehydrogenase [Oscillospiraceae bacterium]
MKVAVIGSGAWGTALAIRLCKNGHDVTMWTFETDLIPEMESTRRNPRLPGAVLPEGLKISGDYACASGCPLVVMASPSFPIRSVCRGVAPFLDENAVMVSVTKGIEDKTLKRMSEVVAEETHRPVVVLTGPSHAEEVALDVPTGCLSACEDQALAEFVQDAFMSQTFRVYTSPDAVGAELGAALKNVIALCAGISDGLGCGDNTKAMLMTRGLTEMARLGVSLGAHKETFAGLSGVGDLIVTCTSMHSRNRRAGILIGQGKSVQDAMKEVGAVVEGYYAARSAWALCKQQGVDMPILQASYEVLYEDVPARESVHNLLTRKRKPEEDMGWM